MGQSAKVLPFRFTEPPVDVPYDGTLETTKVLKRLLKEIKSGAIAPHCIVVMFVDTAGDQRVIPTIDAAGVNRAEVLGFLEAAKAGIIQRWRV